MRFSLIYEACALLLVICLSFICLLPLAAADTAASATSDPISFSDCLPQTMTAGGRVSFANAWCPVKGDLTATALTGVTVLDYYTGTVLAAGADATGASYRPSNGRFFLPDGRAAGAMFCAPQDGTLSHSFTSLCGVRSLQTSSAAQQHRTVGGVVYYAYYDKQDTAKIYYAKTGGYISGQPSDGWYCYDAAADAMYTAGSITPTVAMAYPSAPFSYHIAITLNGHVIWPSEGGDWHYVGSTVGHTVRNTSEDMLASLAAQEALPAALHVKKGDCLAVVATCDEVSNAYLVMVPTVQYAAEQETPVVTVKAGISVYDQFAVRYYLSPVEDATSCGLLVGEEAIPGTKQEDGTYLVTVGDIAAKELNDALCVTPYAVVAGKRVEAAALTVSPAELLLHYVTEQAGTKTADLAAAILDYGAAAQDYFNYHTEAPANAALPTLYCGRQPTQTYQSVCDATPWLSGHSVLPQGMTLRLQDDVAFCLYAGAATVEETLYAQISLQPEFSDATTVPMPYDREKESYVAIFDGIRPAAWNTSYYFRVVDGDGLPLSPTLTYSVASYAVRMKNTTQALDTLLSAMLVFHEASIAYLA